ARKGEGGRLEPVGRSLRDPLLEEERAAHAVDEPLHRARPLAQLVHRGLLGRAAVLDQAELRELRLRERDLVRDGPAHPAPRELAACVERANLDPEVHVIALAGNGSGFCGGYDLVASAEGNMEGVASAEAPPGSPIDPMVQARNHDPSGTWDPVTDYQMMS